jgi:hypothetical protein
MHKQHTGTRVPRSTCIFVSCSRTARSKSPTDSLVPWGTPPDSVGMFSARPAASLHLSTCDAQHAAKRRKGNPHFLFAFATARLMKAATPPEGIEPANHGGCSKEPCTRRWGLLAFGTVIDVHTHQVQLVASVVCDKCCGDLFQEFRAPGVGARVNSQKKIPEMLLQFQSHDDRN